MDYGALVADID